MTIRYRLALDLGSTSLGWAMVLLKGKDHAEPCAVIRAGVRIFPDGRNPKDGSSLAVTRREARAMRRRRDRLLKRKARMMRTLVTHGFFPAEPEKRKALETLNPYALRAKGLDQALSPEEFARALFHINQRRGFKSNRKTDKKDNDSGALKAAIGTLRAQLDPSGVDGKARTVGELLWRRLNDQSKPPEQRTVRARYRELRIPREGGKDRIEKSYDLYVDRAMVEAEFDALWAKQAELNPAQFHEAARLALKDCLLHQRQLRPVKPGRCTLIPEEPRAPLALPSQQRFRILQEVNHLRLLGGRLLEEALSLEQRDKLVAALEAGAKSFKTAIPKLLGLSGAVHFNLADAKRIELKGNATSMELSKKQFFGAAWHGWTLRQQDAIVRQLINQESLGKLVKRLQKYCGVDEARAEHIAEKANFVPGYGSLSAKALARILPALRAEVITYDKAVLAAGFEHHSHISHAASTGEILPELPYYGEYLQRHVGFGTGEPADPPEKRFGRIANPTVHIGLNQVRVVVNALIKRYGHPSEVVVEVARELKQSQEQRREAQEQQAKNQKRNDRLRKDAAAILGIAEERVRQADIQKLILWEELSFDTADRRCPYSGVQISAAMVLSEQVEVEHILPFSMTLDDGLNNKTVAMRQANRVKGNRTPWQARDDFAAQGWDYEAILQRAERMPRAKRQRFAEDGYEKWLKDDKDFLARALNDTRHLSRVAREYLSLICPGGTRVIPGQMTAMLRAKFGLNGILGLDGEKNRNDHRHHAVDACVIAVTDQGLLQRFARASADARGKALDRLVETMPDPWPSYREHVRRAVHAIWVSHKPDHGHEGAMHNDTAYALLGDGRVAVTKWIDGRRTREESALKVIAICDGRAAERHGVAEDGSPRPYKGYKGDSNYCIEVVIDERGRWQGEVISTYAAYQVVRTHGVAQLHNRHRSVSGKPLVMRLTIGDSLRLVHNDQLRTMRLSYVNSAGTLALIECHESNVDKRTRSKELAYVFKTAGSLQKADGRRITISPIGDLRDPGYKG
ncbi:type II CRISPR RNA-guided endonuclease Cas9 [Roseateles sp.]|jgi:CRISPR-associated endonuclease Csn1|uniref:type II CRISPR RNA-guided endonuclease Cas9 n=1 Tax=Roseateles sp. TaxID=1971397 RepID=UPI00391C1B08